jgi:hypothetical protein
MKTRLLTILLALGSLVAAVFTGFSIPASAQTQTVPVQTPSGEIVNVQVDVPPGSTLTSVASPRRWAIADSTSPATRSPPIVRANHTAVIYVAQARGVKPHPRACAAFYLSWIPER